MGLGLVFLVLIAGCVDLVIERTGSRSYLDLMRWLYHLQRNEDRVADGNVKAHM
jgi:hypothetical protein